VIDGSELVRVMAVVDASASAEAFWGVAATLEVVVVAPGQVGVRVFPPAIALLVMLLARSLWRAGLDVGKGGGRRGGGLQHKNACFAHGHAAEGFAWMGMGCAWGALDRGRVLE
jgi:hypothetical protein